MPASVRQQVCGYRGCTKGAQCNTQKLAIPTHQHMSCAVAVPPPSPLSSAVSPQAAPAQSAPPSGNSAASNATAIAAAVASITLLLLAAAGTLLWRQRQRAKAVHAAAHGGLDGNGDGMAVATADVVRAFDLGRIAASQQGRSVPGPAGADALLQSASGPQPSVRVGQVMH